MFSDLINLNSVHYIIIFLPDCNLFFTLFIQL